MTKQILTLEEFGLLPTEEKRKYLEEIRAFVSDPEVTFWMERLYYAVKFLQPNRVAFLDARLVKWYWELVGN